MSTAKQKVTALSVLVAGVVIGAILMLSLQPVEAGGGAASHPRLRAKVERLADRVSGQATHIKILEAQQDAAFGHIEALHNRLESLEAVAGE